MTNEFLSVLIFPSLPLTHMAEIESDSYQEWFLFETEYLLILFQINLI